MSNEVRIKPLLKYEVHYRTYEGLTVDTFTADETQYDPQMGTSFFRTGNTIRVYQTPLEKIIITPVDSDEEIPA